MEHDEEKIRKKIQLADARPIAWNKEFVWQAIDKKPASSSRTLLFYYAAASVLLATALVIFSLERTHQRELDVQLAQLELAIMKEGNQPLFVYRDQTSRKPEEKCTTEAPGVKVREKKKGLPDQAVETQDKKEEIFLTEIEPEQQETVEAAHKEPIILESQSTPAVPRVAAIIGSEKNTMIIPSSADKRMVLKVQFTESEQETLERKSRTGELIFKH